jgi:dipeptidyl aminopeptidase/acylaminoacyl peptidase
MTLFALALLAQAAATSAAPPSNNPPNQSPQNQNEDHRADMILKAADDVLWHLKLGDIADVDKAVFTSLPLAKEPNPTGQGAGNPFIMYAYTFLPKKLETGKKYPLIVLVHGGVHSNFMSGSASNSAHIVRELIKQGYAVIAPEYRGSTGYGAGYWRAIDYGGRENDDVWVSRNWMLETYSGILDPKRVGIIGWSHGGMISLMNIFDHPEGYAVAYAGVPVSDLVARMGYKTDGYRRLFSASYHIGKDANDNVAEYLKRSPVTHAAKLKTPLLIHTATNDEDVNVLEVQRLIAALKAEGKQFDSKIYDNPPGGHHFNRLDTRLARDSRAEIYEFLKKYLKP